MNSYIDDLRAMRDGIGRDIARLEAARASVLLAIAALDGDADIKQLAAPEPVEQENAPGDAAGVVDAPAAAPEKTGRPRGKYHSADGLKRGRWNRDEVAELRRLAAAGYTIKHAAREMGRPMMAVGVKASGLGIHFSGNDARPLMAPDLPPRMAKSTAPVPRPFVRPGPADPGWSVFDDLQLVEGLGAGRKAPEIAGDLDRDREACAARFRALMGIGMGEAVGIAKQTRVLTQLREAAAREEKKMGIAAE